MLETQEGRTVLLIQSRPERSTPPEELVLRVQGFVLQADLPPIRRNQLPANPSRLIDLRQSVTIGGLDAAPFADAVSGVLAIYEHFKLHLRGHNLRPWKPGQEGTYLALTFGNRYLTPAKFAEGEPVADLSLDVDPFNILRPLLTNQVHLQENVVEYWEQESVGTSGQSFRRIKPDLVVPGTMVELQVAFAAVKLGRKDFVFLPKLRAICDYNQSALKRLSLKTVSPLKKVKRKVGYGGEGEQVVEESQRRLKKMSLQDQEHTAEYSDVHMST
ncbi:hypothetical protein BV20DRAFT_941273 [Pilatotrama ljubarskyi]|nr:hypothetical protein BV20DRAFT_941273 [Pilatotrama ljubarskyi]